MTDAKEMGGIVCEIRPKGVCEKDLESYFICSLTHFKVKRGEQNHKEIEK